MVGLYNVVRCDGQMVSPLVDFHCRTQTQQINLALPAVHCCRGLVTTFSGHMVVNTPVTGRNPGPRGGDIRAGLSGAFAVKRINITASSDKRVQSKIKSQEHTNGRCINMTNNYEGKMFHLMQYCASAFR